MQTTTKPITGNAALAVQLAQFNYNALFDKSYTDYLDIVEGPLTEPENPNSRRKPILDLNQRYDFVVWKAEGIKKQVYPGMKDSPTKVAGVKLVSNIPIIPKTRMTLRQALDLNGQICNGTLHIPARYHLIIQEPVITDAEVIDSSAKTTKK